MKIKKYLAENMSEAIRIIKQDLGRDAVIISSRKVRQKGWLGFFKPRLLEVTAAVDRGKVSVPIEKSPDDIFLFNPEDLKNEMTEIKTILRQFTTGRNPLKSKNWDEHLCRWEQNLAECGISEQLSQDLLKGIEIEHDQEPEKIDTAIFEEISGKVYSLLTEVYGDTEKKKILAFIGPTGVGKTTTIAKLAAQFALFQQKKVGIITIDTFRIGAVEQMKTYGDIMDVPVEVVMTPAELKKAVDEHQDKDVILVDTSGRSYKNAMQLGVLKGFLEKIPQAEVFLVLSCTTKEIDLRKNVESFSRLGFSRFIFTKTDETGSLGSMLNLSLELKIPVEYITNGQNVPDDIELMQPEKLVGMVLGGVVIEGPGSKAKRPSSVSV